MPASSGDAVLHVAAKEAGAAAACTSAAAPSQPERGAAHLASSRVMEPDSACVDPLVAPQQRGRRSAPWRWCSTTKAERAVLSFMLGVLVVRTWDFCICAPAFYSPLQPRQPMRPKLNLDSSRRNCLLLPPHTYPVSSSASHAVGTPMFQGHGKRTEGFRNLLAALKSVCHLIVIPSRDHDETIFDAKLI